MVSFCPPLPNTAPQSGDYITKMWGKERESWLAPAGAFQKAGALWTVNTDFPAGGSASIFPTLSDLVNRATNAGRTMGPELKVTPYDALRAATLNAAKLRGEEKNKGSLEVRWLGLGR
jgi:predicted amidohydrolase YtcJ